jgi:hypothetical protein
LLLVISMGERSPVAPVDLDTPASHLPDAQ